MMPKLLIYNYGTFIGRYLLKNDNTFNTWSNHRKTENNLKFTIDLMI